ncbi:MAG: GntR family transcriptional regulator [Acidaminococcus sp.]|jgi:GntR family transcriptional repressor for pyruvate dehydrogenase complex|nr:GntR family transcriptional regulator [Acidaminococcus sp.]MCI2100432.1 GntR family transcriptional regulator [Acidaminococcus sp.]MCI2114753.1 GntR family transcriptional regulator [Acidaminococcus sp.]MCI2116827.1 GntR family transcriptional regulator [Acidaminococcus sp.]
MEKDNESKSLDTMFAPLPKGNISDIIKERITDAILNGELKPGDKLPTEVEFSEKLHVGRNAVREAIKVLVAFGVLEIRRSEGTFVVKEFKPKLIDPLLYGLALSKKSQEEFLEFKIALFCSILYILSLNATEDDLKQLEQYCETFRKAMNNPQVSLEEKYKACLDYQTFLGQATHNPMVMELNSINIKICDFHRRLMIRRSLEQGKPNALPDSYIKDIKMVRAHDRAAIPKLLDEKLAMWRTLE